jgi:uncharacterized membrane protein
VAKAKGRRGRPDVEAEWWTTSDVAAYLGVSLSTVSSYRMRGQMPAADNKLGRTQLWRPETIIQWEKERPGRGNWTRHAH